MLTLWREKGLKCLIFFLISLTVRCELYFSTIISISLNRSVFPWSEIMIGFIPKHFFITLMYETLRMCSALDSLFTRFSPAKREISLLKTIPLFVNKTVTVF